MHSNQHIGMIPAIPDEGFDLLPVGFFGGKKLPDQRSIPDEVFSVAIHPSVGKDDPSAYISLKTRIIQVEYLLCAVIFKYLVNIEGACLFEGQRDRKAEISDHHPEDLIRETETRKPYGNPERTEIIPVGAIKQMRIVMKPGIDQPVPVFNAVRQEMREVKQPVCQLPGLTIDNDHETEFGAKVGFIPARNSSCGG
jgi:hypothetical protein